MLYEGSHLLRSHGWTLKREERMSDKGDDAAIRRTIAVLQDIAVSTGENELLNAISREARFLIVSGEALLVGANPHVEDREELVKWAQDCADLVDYINAVALRH